MNVLRVKNMAAYFELVAANFPFDRDADPKILQNFFRSWNLFRLRS